MHEKSNERTNPHNTMIIIILLLFSFVRETKKNQNEDEKQTKSIQSFKKQTMSEHEQNNKIEWNNAHARTHDSASKQASKHTRIQMKSANKRKHTHIDITHSLEIKSIQMKTFSAIFLLRLMLPFFLRRWWCHRWKTRYRHTNRTVAL